MWSGLGSDAIREQRKNLLIFLPSPGCVYESNVLVKSLLIIKSDFTRALWLPMCSFSHGPTWFTNHKYLRNISRHPIVLHQRIRMMEINSDEAPRRSDLLRFPSNSLPLKRKGTHVIPWALSLWLRQGPYEDLKVWLSSPLWFDATEEVMSFIRKRVVWCNCLVCHLISSVALVFTVRIWELVSHDQEWGVAFSAEWPITTTCVGVCSSNPRFRIVLLSMKLASKFSLEPRRQTMETTRQSCPPTGLKSNDEVLESLNQLIFKRCRCVKNAFPDDQVNKVVSPLVAMQVLGNVID